MLQIDHSSHKVHNYSFQIDHSSHKAHNYSYLESREMRGWPFSAFILTELYIFLRLNMVDEAVQSRVPSIDSLLLKTRI